MADATRSTWSTMRGKAVPASPPTAPQAPPIDPSVIEWRGGGHLAPIGTEPDSDDRTRHFPGNSVRKYPSRAALWPSSLGSFGPSKDVSTNA